MIDARIDSHITVETASLPPVLLRRIISELSPRDPDKDRAIAEKVRGADDLADDLNLWRADGHSLVLPRGFVHRLEQLATEVGETIQWESWMRVSPTSERCFRDWPAFELRDEYQTPARDSLLDWAQGILQLPTGGGKTKVAIEAARWAGQKTIVLVHTTALARQWQAAVKDTYGYETGYIGEGEWIDRDFTVAMRQTLWSRFDEIDPEWFEQWGMVIIDEVHHASSATLSELVGRFPAFYRIGLSATPRWDPLLFPIVEAVIGPVIHRTTHDDVGEHLIKPSVRLIESSFEAEYLPTRMEGRRRVQNNYSDVMAALVSDRNRNDLIAGIARDEAQAGHHVLIVTRRIEHVKQMVDRLEKVLRIGSTLNVLTGAQTGADAQRIGRTIENLETGSVLVSTVADEALDYPRLDRIVLGFPLRRLPLVEQQIGRIVRPSSGKEDAIVYDVTDPRVGVLKSQRRDRVQLYAKRGWKVERPEVLS